jgi:general secretion pathway protein D
MRTIYVRLALAAAMTVTALGVVNVAIAQGPEGPKFDLVLKDADMVTAAQTLTKMSGLQFLVEPRAEAFPKITLSLKGITAEEALAYICRAAGAYYRRDEAGVYIIGGKPSVEKPPVTSEVPNEILPKVARKLKLKSGDPRDVFVQLLGQLPNANQGFVDIEMFKRLTEEVKFKKIGDPVQVNTPVYQPTPTQQFSQPLNRMEGGNGITLPGEGGAQTGGLGGPAGGGFGPQGGQGQGPGGQGQGGGNITPGQGLVPSGIDHISYDPTDNSIVVRGTEEAIAELQRNIALFDVAPRQVVIKVEFITTSNDLARSLGIDFLYQRGAIFAGARPGTFARVGDPIFINYATGNLTTRLRTLLSEGYGKVVQAPIVRTLNNQPASVFQFIQVNTFLSQVITTAGGQVIVAPQLITIPIQTGLSVAPRINDDGTITMYLAPTVQELSGITRGPNGEEAPNLLGQTISVVARVRNNETIVLGGLTRKQETSSVLRFPVLSDLPIIGQFFRSTNRTVNNQELLIFVTPTIVEDDETLGGGG